MHQIPSIRDLKGAPASLILALLFHPAQSLGAGTLAEMTDYSDKPVAAGLQTLRRLDMAQQHGRYHGWTATAAIRQLVLGELPEPEKLRLESENLRLPGSSGSSSIEAPPLLPTPTTTTPSEPEKLRLPSAWAILHDVLIDDCATPRALADKTIHNLIHRHRAPARAHLQALLWLSYCHSEEGSGIDWPGAFIPAKLTNNEPCPPWHSPTYGDPLYRRIEAARSELQRDA